MILFSTGTCNPVSNPISPVLKITSNPRTVARMKEHLDVDISDVLSGTRPCAQPVTASLMRLSASPTVS